MPFQILLFPSLRLIGLGLRRFSGGGIGADRDLSPSTRVRAVRESLAAYMYIRPASADPIAALGTVSFLDLE